MTIAVAWGIFYVVQNSGEARNFVREGPATWRTFDCSFRLFSNSWKLGTDIKHKWKSQQVCFGRGMVSSASFWLRYWCRKD